MWVHMYVGAHVCGYTCVWVHMCIVQTFGFVHGVMNSDNMAVGGFTLDFGPFGFMETANTGWTPNLSDDEGMYVRM